MHENIDCYQNKTIKPLIQRIFSEGFFLATETRFNKGHFKQAISISSTSSHWYRIEFEERKKQTLTIAVGSIDEQKEQGYICISLSDRGFVTGINSSNPRFTEWLVDFSESKFDSERTLQLQHEYESAPTNSVFNWEVITGQL